MAAAAAAAVSLLLSVAASSVAARVFTSWLVAVANFFSFVVAVEAAAVDVVVNVELAAAVAAVAD